MIGPKKIKNNKPKKAIKKIKGQKDIRTILQSKKHELIKYSEDFDNVCKKSGVDIDSEELQVLIAISKSLQNDTESEHYRSLKLNTQERNSTIRKTLQEYGFKVPNIKIPDRKVKKFKKQYKLLTVSSVEKQQIISDRYSQILLKNLENHSENSTLNGLIPLYNLATNAVYETIRDNSVYYVNNLVEKSNSNGCLFKDYANIPGRPVSPKLLDDCCKMNFSEIDCSQEELDVVLSGNIKSAKNILYSKQRTKCINKVFNMSGVTIENVNNYETENNINLQENKYLACKENSNEKDNETTNSVNKLLTITQTKQYRSCSPDIFDDEVSAILDDNETVNTNNRANTCNSDSNLQNKTTKSITLLTQNVESTHEKSIKEIDISSVKLFSNKIENETTKRMLCGFESENKEDISLLQKHNATKPADDFMDLTECVQRKNIFKIANCSEEMSQYNKTRRKSNDLMEITECISTKAIDNIDLTQCNQKTANKECDSMGENIDLTQSSNSNGSSDELPFVCLNKSNSLDTTVILDENEYTVSSNTPIKLYNQIVNISHDSREGKYNKSIFEDYVHDHSESSRKFSDIEIFDNINNEVNIQNTEKKIKNNNMVDISTNSDQLNYENILQSSLEGYNAKKDLKTTTNYINIIDSNIPHDKSKYSNDENNLSEYLHLQNKETGHQNFKCPTNSNDIDLTQSSNSDEDYNEGNDFKNHEKKYVAPFLLHKNSQLNSLNKASKEKDSEENRNFNIDLTQDKYDYHEILKTQKKLPRTNSLCQENNGSLDYDEINDPNETKTDSVNSSTVHNDKGIDLTEESNNELVFCNNIDSKRNSEPECSQHSEIFEISDKELDYSLYKSRHENCDVSGELNKLEWNKIIPNTSRKDQSNTVNKISKEIENGEENEHCNIDLSENVKQCCKILKTCNKFPRARSLSEKDNVSVDYDINNDYETGEYVAYHIDKELDVEHGNNDLLIINDNFDSKRKLEPNCSQHSEVFEICDQELDHSVYQELDQSVYKSRHENFEIGGLSIMKNLSEIDKQSPDIVKNKILPKNNSPDLQLLTDMRNKATPKGVLNSKLCMKTPENSEYIIKITEVTPILNYESLSTPERNQELDKYGIKPLKRKRGKFISITFY